MFALKRFLFTMNYTMAQILKIYYSKRVKLKGHMLGGQWCIGPAATISNLTREC